MDDGDDRDRRGCLLGGKAFAGAGDDDDVHGSAHQIGDVTLDQLFAAAGEALVESDVGSVDIAQFAHLLEKAAKIAGIRCAGCDRNKAHDRSRSSLLRTRRQRPRCRRAAEQRDELAASDHSMTSSARASRVAGTMIPMAFAALTLTINSKRVGCSTGRSAGLVPLNILSTYVANR